jgi:competence protein ComEA
LAENVNEGQPKQAVLKNFSHSLSKGLFIFCLLILCFLTAGWAFRRAGLQPGAGPGLPERRIVIEVSEGFNRPGLYAYSKAPAMIEVVRDAGGLVPGFVMPDPAGKFRFEQEGLLRAFRGPEGKTTFEHGPLSNRALWILGRPLPLNHLSREDLDRLPGIGPAMAARIIEYRETQGGFSSLEELQQVKGIKEKTFEKIKGYFVLS